MPRFFFHIYDDADCIDDEGDEFTSIEAAKEEAIRGARSIAAEQVCHGHLKLHHRIEIETEAGQTVAIVTFRDAITVEG